MARVVRIGVIQGSVSSLGIAALWLFLLPQVRDEVNLMPILVVVAVLGVAFLQQMKAEPDIRSSLYLLSPAFFLFLLSLVTSTLRLPGLSSIREVILVMAIFLSGLFFSRIAGLEATLFGILAGATVSAAVSWVLGFDDFPTLSEYLMGGAIEDGGVSGNRAIEYLSALMGIAAGLALLKKTGWSRWVVSPMTLLLMWTLVESGSLTARFAVLSILAALLLLSLGRTKLHPVAGWVALVLSVGAAAAVTLMAILRTGAVSIASCFFGKDDSLDLDARLLSWRSILGALDPAGVVFGYGATFWLDGSPSAEMANQPLQELNYGPFDIGHSIYIDTFVAFGLMGLVVVIFLVWSVLSRATTHRNNPRGWAPYSAPWIFAVAIAVSGITDSIVAYRPIGWLLLGLLYGAMVSGLDVRDILGAQRRRLAHRTSSGSAKPR